MMLNEINIMMDVTKIEWYNDVATGFAMVGQRYYSPELCRFIQPADISNLNPRSINGLNLYSYCYNDPVMYSDGSGHFPVLLLLGGLLFGALAGGVFDEGIQLIKNDWDFSSLDWGSIANSTIVGGALGLSLALGVAYLGPVLAGIAGASGKTALIAFGASSAISFGAGALGYATEEWMNDRRPDFWTAMMHGGFVMLEGMISFGVGGIVGSVGNVGTKGKYFNRKGWTKIFGGKEWWLKFIFGQEFTLPSKILINFLRDNI